MQARLNGLMEGWQEWVSWDTPAKRLRGARKARQLTQDALALASGVKQSDISKLERGDSSSSRSWPQLARALGVNALWLSAGDGEPMALEEDVAAETLGIPSVGQAIEVLATALSSMDEIGRELASGVLASIAKRPDQPEGATAMLAALIQHHGSKAPPPSPSSPSSGKKAKRTTAAAQRRAPGRVALTVTQGGGQKRQLALPLRTVADPFNADTAPRREQEWYERVKAAPKAASSDDSRKPK
jgi:transcriptional regulator with XRE-family HTH domain